MFIIYRFIVFKSILDTWSNPYLNIGLTFRPCYFTAIGTTFLWRYIPSLRPLSLVPILQPCQIGQVRCLDIESNGLHGLEAHLYLPPLYIISLGIFRPVERHDDQKILLLQLVPGQMTLLTVDLDDPTTMFELSCPCAIEESKGLHLSTFRWLPYLEIVQDTVMVPYAVTVQVTDPFPVHELAVRHQACYALPLLELPQLNSPGWQITGKQHLGTSPQT